MKIKLYEKLPSAETIVSNRTDARREVHNARSYKIRRAPLLHETANVLRHKQRTKRVSCHRGLEPLQTNAAQRRFAFAIWTENASAIHEKAQF